MAAGTEKRHSMRDRVASRKGAARIRPIVASAVAVTLSAPQAASSDLVRFDAYPVSDVLEKLFEDKTTGRKITDGAAKPSEITAAFLRQNRSAVRPRVEKSREMQASTH